MLRLRSLQIGRHFDGIMLPSPEDERARALTRGWTAFDRHFAIAETSHLEVSLVQLRAREPLMILLLTLIKARSAYCRTRF